ncbi:MAG TPA: hypothetical protein PKW17_12545 [Smithellaceae bacterium]|nr:hypothetical protein [Smithellaceae bacterium]
MDSKQDYFDPRKESRRIVSQFGEVNKRQVSESQQAAEAAALAKKKPAERSDGGSSQESS